VNGRPDDGLRADIESRIGARRDDVIAEAT
jgi:hypothetical protein